MKKRLVTICALGVFFGLGGIASASLMNLSWEGRDYAVYTDWTGTWEQARNEVQSTHGGSWDLATITSAGEQNFLGSMLSSNHLSGEFWLGGYQDTDMGLAADEGWHWVTGEEWDYSSWAADEPNDWAGINEQHLGIWSKKYWNWNDEHGSSNIRGFIAENHTGAAPVPEPATVFLLGTGLVGMAGLRRRQKK